MVLETHQVSWGQDSGLSRRPSQPPVRREEMEDAIDSRQHSTSLSLPFKTRLWLPKLAVWWEGCVNTSSLHKLT